MRIAAAAVLSLVCAWSAVPAGAASKAQEKILADAKKAVKTGRPAEAAAGFRAFVAAVPDDERAPWALTQAADLDAGTGHQAEAIAGYAEVVKRYPRSPDARVARAKLTALSGSVMGTAQARLEAAKTEEERVAALWGLGEAHEQGGDLGPAAAAYRDVRTSSRVPAWKRKAAAKLESMVAARVAAAADRPPDAARFREIADLAEAAEQWDRAAEYHLRAGAAGAEPGAILKGKLGAARVLTLARRPARAHKFYAEIRAADPPPDVAEEVARAQGLLYEDHRDFAGAVATYDGWLAAAGAGEETVWARRRRAWCLERLGRTEAAWAAYQEMAASWPRHIAAAESLLAIGRIAEARRDYGAARKAYARCAGDFGGTRNGEEAKARLLGLARRQAEWERTRAEIARMAESYARRERRVE